MCDKKLRRRKSSLFLNPRQTEDEQLSSLSEGPKLSSDASHQEEEGNMNIYVKEYQKMVKTEKKDWKNYYIELKNEREMLIKERKISPCENFDYFNHLDEGTKKFLRDLDEVKESQAGITKSMETALEDIRLLHANFILQKQRYHIIQENFINCVTNMNPLLISSSDMNIDFEPSEHYTDETNCEKPFLYCDSD